MCVLDNSTSIKILKETTIFHTHVDDFLLKLFCYTPLGVSRYENH